MRGPTVVVGLIGLACSGGSGSPTQVNPLSVSGFWNVTSTLQEDTCDSELPGMIVSTIQITQAGNQLTFEPIGSLLPLTGTIDASSGNFTVSAAISSEDFSLHAVLSGRFTSDTRYTGELNETLSLGPDSCVLVSSEVGQRQ